MAYIHLTIIPDAAPATAGQCTLGEAGGWPTLWSCGQCPKNTGKRPIVRLFTAHKAYGEIQRIKAVVGIDKADKALKLIGHSRATVLPTMETCTAAQPKSESALAGWVIVYWDRISQLCQSGRMVNGAVPLGIGWPGMVLEIG